MTNFWNKLNKPIIALAPMAGITDSSFRIICKRYGADVLYTEMVSAAGLCYEGKKTLSYLKFKAKEKPVVLQLFGSDPKQFAQAAKIVEKAGFSGIDINFGCPAKKVVQNNSGCTLMDNLDNAYEIIKATCEATSLPVSIKMRKSKGKTTASMLVERIKDLPVQAIMIHGRSFEQAFNGDPDWEEVKKVRKIYKGILLANGGIYTPEDAKKVLEETQVDGIGIAQGAWGKPWLFKQIKSYLKTNTYKELSWQQMKKAIIKHAKLSVKDKDNLIELRKHLLWYVKGHKQAKELKKQLVAVSTLKDIQNILKKY
ncbi:MAG: tRNA dihydrouridine synthase [Candidatus Komeilibacteria bacterium]